MPLVRRRLSRLPVTAKEVADAEAAARWPHTLERTLIWKQLPLQVTAKLPAEIDQGFTTPAETQRKHQAWLARQDREIDNVLAAHRAKAEKEAKEGPDRREAERIEHNGQVRLNIALTKLGSHENHGGRFVANAEQAAYLRKGKALAAELETFRTLGLTDDPLTVAAERQLLDGFYVSGPPEISAFENNLTEPLNESEWAQEIQRLEVKYGSGAAAKAKHAAAK